MVCWAFESSPLDEINMAKNLLCKRAELDRNMKHDATLACEYLDSLKVASVQYRIVLFVLISSSFWASGCSSTLTLQNANEKTDGMQPNGIYIPTAKERTYSCAELERITREWVGQAQKWRQHYEVQTALPAETVALAVERSKGVSTAGYSASYRFDDAVARAEAYNSELLSKGCWAMEIEARLDPESRQFAQMRRQAKLELNRIAE